MELNKNNVLKIILILFSTVAFCIGLINLSSVWIAIKNFLSILTPIILGLCIAFLLDPLVTAIENKLYSALSKRTGGKGKTAARALGIFTSLIVVSGVIALLILLVVPEVQEAFTIIGNTLPSAITKLIGNINDLLDKFDVTFRIPTSKTSDWTDLIATAKEYIQSAFESGALNDIASTALSLLSGFTNFLLGLIFSIYVLMQKEKIAAFISRFIRAYSKEKTSARIFKTAHLSKVSFRNFVTGQLTEALIIAMLCFIGMLIFRFPYPTAASAVIGVTALVPVFGAWIGGILGALLALSESPMKALLFIVFLIGLQQLEGNLIYPRVVGKSVGLPSILVFISVILGASVAGVLGMLLAVPICSIVYVLTKEAVEKRLSKKKTLTELAEIGIIPTADP